MRCLFTMFAEDVGLLPERVFTEHLEKEWIPHPERFPADVEALWQGMNVGKYVFGIGQLLRFNGGLFTAPSGLALTKAHLTLLLEAAKCNWADVEPAIFGTLLERALDPVERHQLGAHFTPRAYVERLVKPTIEEPMREDWDVVRTEAHKLVIDGKTAEAIKVVRDFHHRLCHTRVVDPACGPGNFLYVTRDLFKRLEAEVLALLKELGDKTDFLNVEGLSVTPQQFLGIEVKPWAKEIAELVLWIGYLQWHYRTHGKTPPREPVLHDYKNLECRDAVLAYDREELVCDPKTAKPTTRWDGRTYKKSPVTGEDVPDESARTELYRYVNPRKAEWPEAEFVVGNPPFIGKLLMQDSLGQGYVKALRDTFSGDVPDGCDLVMYWWFHSARLAASRRVRRAGLITTNGITQVINRQVVSAALGVDTPVSLDFAIPDHPWVSSESGAAVRIAMSAFSAGVHPGHLGRVIHEAATSDGTVDVTLEFADGQIQPDFRTGPPISTTVSLRANSGLSGTGLMLGSRGFVLSREAADELRTSYPRSSSLIHPLRNGHDLTQRSRDVFVIDAFECDESMLRADHPAVFQRLHNLVYPERKVNKDPRLQENWWMFRRTNEQVRDSLRTLPRFVATVETAKHRVFVFLDAEIRPEHKLIVVGSDDAMILGVLSSRIHVTWALPSGGHLGVGNDPVYSKTRCFEPFPFPSAGANEMFRIRALGESLDAHRKRQQALHPGLTITGMYNVLAKLRSGEALTAKEKVIHEQGLVSVLKQIHDDLDAAVFDAYGWPRDLSDEQILERLVALNRERAEEEKRGLVRWPRPEFQAPKGAVPATQVALTGTEAEEAGAEVAPAAEAAWPKKLPAQIAAVRDFFRSSPSRAARLDDVTRAFKGAKKKDVEPVLDSLTALGLLTAFDAAGERRWRAELRAAA
jgi:hypothetical protein